MIWSCLYDFFSISIHPANPNDWNAWSLKFSCGSPFRNGLDKKWCRVCTFWRNGGHIGQGAIFDLECFVRRSRIYRHLLLLMADVFIANPFRARSSSMWPWLCSWKVGLLSISFGCWFIEFWDVCTARKLCSSRSSSSHLLSDSQVWQWIRLW